MTPRINEKEDSTTVEELGERSVIEIMQKRLTIMPAQPVSFGDDVAAISLDNKHVAVLKTDMLVNKSDVPKGMNLRQAARKAVVMNVSDFAAKGVQPTAALVSLGLPRTSTRKDVEEIADGLNIGAREYGTYIVGGDTGETSDFVMAISLYGTEEKSKLMLRNGARDGDILAVTGLFGNPAAGLRLLADKCKVSNELKDLLLDSVYLPKARLKEGLALAGSGVVTASIDSSDGLAWSLHELSRMSQVGVMIEKLPIADEVTQFAECCGTKVIDLVLYGGEEYELVITVKPNYWNDALAAVEAVGGKLFRIGRVIKKRQVVLEKNGKKQLIKPQGWEHFKSTI